MRKPSRQPPVAYCFSAPRAPRLPATFGPDAIAPIPPNGFAPHGFALAASLHFVVSGHVAFPEQSSLVLARATEILAQLGEELAFVEPGNLTNDDSLSLNL